MINENSLAYKQKGCKIITLTDSERITIDKMLEGADLNLWDDGMAEGQAKGQRETMQKLFIKGKITYEDLVELLGEKEAEAIKNIRDKTEGALEEEEEN